MAVCSNCVEYSKDNIRTDTYKELLMKLTSSFTPKQLSSAVVGVCIENNVDYHSIDMNTAFLTKKNAQKIFIELCMKGREVCTKGRDGEVIKIDSEESDIDCSNELIKGK